MDTPADPEQDDEKLGQQTQLPLQGNKADSRPSNGEAEFTGQRHRQLSEEDAIIAAVADHGCQMWLRMSRWAKVNEILEPRERSLAYSVGKRLRDGALPTIRQSRWAQSILAKALQLGFDTTATD